MLISCIAIIPFKHRRPSKKITRKKRSRKCCLSLWNHKSSNTHKSRLKKRCRLSLHLALPFIRYHISKPSLSLLREKKNIKICRPIFCPKSVIWQRRLSDLDPKYQESNVIHTVQKKATHLIHPYLTDSFWYILGKKKASALTFATKESAHLAVHLIRKRFIISFCLDRWHDFYFIQFLFFVVFSLFFNCSVSIVLSLPCTASALRCERFFTGRMAPK